MLSISQKRLFQGVQTVSIYEDKIKYEIRTLFSYNQFVIEINDLEPQPRKYKHIPILWICLSIIALIVDLLLLRNVLVAKNGEQFWNSIIHTGFITLLLVVFSRNIFLRWEDAIIFYGTNSQIVLWFNNPEEEQFSEFVTQLAKNIHNAKSETDNRDEKFLQILKAEGLLGNWQYEQAIEMIRKMRE